VRHRLKTSESNDSNQLMLREKLMSEVYFGLTNDSWIVYCSHSFRTFCYSDIFEWLQFTFVSLQFHSHLNFKPVDLTDLESHGIYSTQRCVSRIWFRKLCDRYWSSSCVTTEMYWEAIIIQTVVAVFMLAWKYTWRSKCLQLRWILGGSNHVKLEVYLEVLNLEVVG